MPPGHKNSITSSDDKTKGVELKKTLPTAGMQAPPTLRLLLAIALALPLSTHAASIYLCKSYSGGTFWSNAHCGTQKATIERIVSVPDNMPFDQQVQLGNQAASEAARLAAPPVPPVPQTIQRGTTSPSTEECKALDERVRYLDALARQPQSASTQDWITGERKAARDKQFQLRCR